MTRGPCCFISRPRPILGHERNWAGRTRSLRFSLLCRSPFCPPPSSLLLPFKGDLKGRPRRNAHSFGRWLRACCRPSRLAGASARHLLTRSGARQGPCRPRPWVPSCREWLPSLSRPGPAWPGFGWRCRQCPSWPACLLFGTAWGRGRRLLLHLVLVGGAAGPLACPSGTTPALLSGQLWGTPEASPAAAGGQSAGTHLLRDDTQ